MRLLRLALVPGAVAVALLAEWAVYRPGDLVVVVADAVVGVLLVACGVVAWERRASSRVGPLMALSGYTWFAGNFWPAALYLHRGPLIHLHISYPTGRVRRRLAKATVAIGYVAAAVEPIARNDAVTVVVALLVAAAALDIFLRTSGTARRAGIPALAAALAFAAVLAASATQRLAGWDADREALLAYDVVIACLAVLLLVDLLRARWAEAVVADLVVDLGRPADARSLQETLGRALGDRSLVLGYWLAEQERYVDAAGRSVTLPEPGTGRSVTAIDRAGEPVAVLIHDEAVQGEPELVDAVAAAASLAVTNARLQAQIRARVGELAASRRRIVEAGDAQRRRLAQELREGAEHRLATIDGLLAEARAGVPEPSGRLFDPIDQELDSARTELRDFAHGIRPGALVEGGLPAALPALAARAGVPVELTVTTGRQPPAVEAAIYFLCSEALANAAKHAQASRVSVTVTEHAGGLRVAIADDGVGGADPARGSGLRGLADRMAALGGGLSVESPPHGGTRLVADVDVHAG